jgi:excisionase family DNA binding protein
MIQDYANPVRCEPLMDAERAAEILDIHPKTVKRLAAAGVIPGMKIGRVWRFRESELDAYIVRQLQWPGHPSPKGEAFQ